MTEEEKTEKQERETLSIEELLHIANGIEENLKKAHVHVIKMPPGNVEFKPGEN